jgi:hypothetical protein
MLARDTNIGDWNLPPPGRGGRDSNGNEHLGMFAVAGSPAEDSSTSGTPVRSTPVHLQYHPPTPPLPRSAPYIEKDLRSSNRNGYSYDFMIADLDAEAQSMHHVPLSPILEEAEDPTPIVTQPTKNTLAMYSSLSLLKVFFVVVLKMIMVVHICVHPDRFVFDKSNRVVVQRPVECRIHD